MTFNHAGQLTHRTHYGPADLALVDEVFTTAGESEGVYWLLPDQQGTIRHVADDEAILRKHVEYDSFGKIGSETHYGPGGGSPSYTDQRLYFTGQEWDIYANFYNYGGRWYAPSWGRFVSEDPTGLDAGDANFYRYVHNNPVIYVDPTGLVQAGNPLNALFGGFSSGIVAKFNPISDSLSAGNNFASFGTPKVSAPTASQSALLKFSFSTPPPAASYSPPPSIVWANSPGFTTPTVNAVFAAVPNRDSADRYPSITADNRSWVTRTADSLTARLRNGQSLVHDPAAHQWIERDDGQKYLVREMHENAGPLSEIAGNIYHRTPLGGIIDRQAQMSYAPVRTITNDLKGGYNLVTNVHRIPEMWETLPDYKKQDIGVNLAAQLALSYGMPTILAKPAGATTAPSNYPTGTFSITKQKLETYPAGVPDQL